MSRSKHYASTFLQTLREQDEELTDLDIDDPKGLNAAVGDQLDPGTNSSQFNHTSDEFKQLTQQKMKIEAGMVNTIKEWIGKIDGFTDFLNGVEDSSIQSILANAVPDSIFDSIRGTESKKIAKVAAELGSLSQLLKGQLAQSTDPKYWGV